MTLFVFWNLILCRPQLKTTFVTWTPCRGKICIITEALIIIVIIISCISAFIAMEAEACSWVKPPPVSLDLKNVPQDSGLS